MKKNKKVITLDGSNLSIEDIYLLVSDSGVTVEISPKNISSIEKSRKFLEKEIDKRVVYGVNTGFGPMASYIIRRDKLEELQENLIRSHASGIGDPIKEEFVLAAMVVRLNTLVKGYSGVSLDLLKRLEFFINKRVLPIVPEHGAVGTSGDLVQLAHIALAIIGEGEVFYKGERQKTKSVLKKLNTKPYKLKIKEGLALINGTACMAGISALVCRDARQALNNSVQLGAFATEIINGFNDSTSEKLHRLRHHKGQVTIAKVLRGILSSSNMRKNRRSLYPNGVVNSDKVHEIPEQVQEIYSFRCIAQILGPVWETLNSTEKKVEIEINSVTDNPVVDWENHSFLHGGNFHGDYIASSIDQLKASFVKLTMLSERRVNFFLNQSVNKHFPPFLNLENPGFTLALQGLQFVATSTTAQSQSLAFPHHIHSIPTNADNQDVVSMGTDAALFTVKVIENAFVVLAIELITLTQAMECIGGKEALSTSSKKLFKSTRKIFPKVQKDRTITEEIPSVIKLLYDNKEISI